MDREHAFPIAESFAEEFNYRVEQLSRLTDHPTSKGRFIELLLIRLLRKYLPKKYEFSSGFYCSIDSSCSQKASQQLDVICFDHFNFPLFFSCDEIVAVTPKAVRGVVEVKSLLDKKSISQILSQSNCEIAQQLPLDTSFNLLSVKSQISPDAVCQYILKQYGENKSIVRRLGTIYSLDWEDIIVFDVDNKKYEMYILQNFNYGISSFLNFLIRDFYGKETYMSVANLISSSLFIPRKTFLIRED